MAIAFGSSASLSGLLSARPAPDASQAGRFYLATDEGVMYRDSGTAWSPCGLQAPEFNGNGLAGDGGATLEFEGGTGAWTTYDLANALGVPSSALAIMIKHNSGSITIRGGSSSGTGLDLQVGQIVIVQLSAGNCGLKYTGDVTWEVSALLSL